MIKEIEKIFYSKIEESYNIDNEKKEKLLKIRKLNQKYLNNYHLLACVKTSIILLIIKQILVHILIQ